MHPIITRDPISGNELIVTRLESPQSGIVIEGQFSLGWIGRLTREQLDFVELLVKNRGNIQKLAQDLEMAYNTARSRLDEIVIALGGAPEDDRRADRLLVLNRLHDKEISIESGQITAAQAAQLLDTLLPKYEQSGGQVENRTVRIWMTDMSTNRRKMNMTATMPVYLVSMSLHLLARMVMQLNESTIQNMIHAIERGTTGRLLDLQDLEEGKRLEIFVEK